MRPVTEARIGRLCRALGTLEHPALWDDFPPPAQVDWPDLFELANRFWLGPALACAVVRHPRAGAGGTLESYCRWLIAGSRRRHAALEAELARLVAFCNGRGIEPLLLKGAAELWDEPADRRGRRWMVDLDVLLPAPAVEPTWRALRAHGYREFDAASTFTWRAARTRKHAPPLVGPCGVTVELHRRLGDAPLLTAAPPAWERAVAPAAQPSLRAWRLTASGKVVQAIAHDLLDHGHYRARVLDLRYGYHLHLLAAAGGERIDWPAVERAFARHPGELAAARRMLSWFLPGARRSAPSGAAVERWLAESLARLNTPRDTLRRQAQRNVWRVMAGSIVRPAGVASSVRQQLAARAHQVLRAVRLLARPRWAVREASRRTEAEALRHHPRLLGAGGQAERGRR